MAKYNKSKLYFFKLPSSFFKRDEIEWLKTQNNGYKVIVIYQELIFETINKDGILARRIGDEIKAYSTEEIARLINEDIVDVSRDFLYDVEISTFLNAVLGKNLSHTQSAHSR